MAYTSNREPRRRWRTDRHRERVPCASCGAPARLHSAELPFCNTCLDRARQSSVTEWDDLGTGDSEAAASPRTELIESNDHGRPVAYVAMQDRAARQRIVNVLERAGWAVIPQPSGFHLLQALAGVIDGNQHWLRPGLIVVDAHSRGCAGTTIAAGLRDLGITIPIVLIAAAGETLLVSPDQTLRIVDSASVESTVADIAAIARIHDSEHCPAA